MGAGGCAGPIKPPAFSGAVDFCKGSYPQSILDHIQGGMYVSFER